MHFENLKSITSDQISQNARGIMRLFVYNILNKIIKESIFSAYFSVKYFHSFICPFSQTFNNVCGDLVMFLFFFTLSFRWSVTVSSDEANRLSQPFCFLFQFRASPIASIATFVLDFITSICTV